MTEPQDKAKVQAAPLAGRVVAVSSWVAMLILFCGLGFAHAEEGLSRPFRFSGEHLSLMTNRSRADLCFTLGIGILLGLPVLRDLLVLVVSWRRGEKKQAALAALGAGALSFVYAMLWWASS